MADNRTCAENQRHCTRYTSSSSSAAICGLPTRWRIPEMDMSFCCNTPVLLVAKVGGERCRCSKIMSPHNCNQTLSPCKDGDDESERVPTGESDCECSGREAKCTRSRPSAAD